MSRLDDYQSALLAAFPDVAGEALVEVFESRGGEFAAFVIDHGLGPRWHERTKREEFRECRLAAEALYLAQEHALRDIDGVFEASGIKYALIKGAASRLRLYRTPAVRACHDLDILVHPSDRVRAAGALVGAGFVAEPVATSISRELILTRGEINVDLHWALLREGRLRNDPTGVMLARRQRRGSIWTLNSEDALFVSLVHPAFAKHLAGWDMGLHRVMDILESLAHGEQTADWHAVCSMLQQNGVQSAAWATLQWVVILSGERAPPQAQVMMSALRLGRLRKIWLDRWLRKDISARTANMHWARLLGFSVFLHDTLSDSLRAFIGRRRAWQRSSADLEVFRALDDQ